LDNQWRRIGAHSDTDAETPAYGQASPHAGAASYNGLPKIARQM